MSSNGNGNGNGNGKKRKMDMDVLEIGSFGSFGIGPETTTSADMYSDKLDLFSVMPTEKQMQYFRETRIFPTAGISESGPYTFQVPAQSSLFLDAGSIKMEGELAIYERKDDGTQARLADDAKINVINMLPVSTYKIDY